MPSYRFLSADDRWALVARIKRFSPGFPDAGLRVDEGTGTDAAPVPDASRRDEGRRLWTDLGCPACHGEDGRGRTREEAGAAWTDQRGVAVPRSGDLTHACALRGGASPRALARAILHGVGDAMPAYAGSIERDDLEALLGYLAGLRDRPGEGRAAPTVTGPDTGSRPSPTRSPAR